MEVSMKVSMKVSMTTLVTDFADLEQAGFYDNYNESPLGLLEPLATTVKEPQQPKLLPSFSPPAGPRPFAPPRLEAKKKSEETLRLLGGDPAAFRPRREIMRRPSSAPRVSEAPSQPPLTTAAASQSRCSRRTGERDDDRREQLPTCDPLSHAARKERSRLRSAENAVHAIPLLLVLCAFLLWFFSGPGSEL
ncbi:hypothetical protein NL676_010368 [Syzygium grande]|nr:hypothetical protein NL676_010368 [Syzygium grande]